MRTVTGLRVDLYSKFPEKFVGVSLKQGDPTTLIIGIYENGAAYDLTGCDFILNATISDGSAHIQTVGMTALINVLTIVLDDEIYDGASGLLQLELIITKSVIPISTFIMSMDLEPKLIATGTVETAAADALITVITESLRAPYIGENGNWFEWDTTTGAFADSGTPSSAVAEPYVTSQKNVANGIAGLDADSKISMAQLPSDNLLALINRPKIQINQIVNRSSSPLNVGTTYITFCEIYHVFDCAAKTTGVCYAIQTPVSTNTVQGIFRSLDYGLTWTKLGDITLNLAGGERLEKLFVEPAQETLVILKNMNIASPTYSVLTYSAAMVLLGTLDIGGRTWHSAYHNIDAINDAAWSTRIIMFAEYINSANESICPTVRVWKTVNRGINWTIAFEQTANAGVSGSGEVSHFHTLQIDPYTGYWYLSSGDFNAQCKIWRSTNEGVDWTLLFEGDQKYRTLSFVFTSTHVYYVMDSSNAPDPSKVIRFHKTTLTLEELATTYNGLPCYGITKTNYPKGFIVWLVYELGASAVSTKLPIQFFDLTDMTLKTIFEYDIGTPMPRCGISEASRYQSWQDGSIFFLPTPNLYRGAGSYNELAVSSSISTYLKGIISC